MFKVDTGAEASILPRTVYNRLQHKPKLLASNARIITYGAKESIPVDGQCICQVTLMNGTTRHLRFLVVPFDEEPLLGLRATRHMDLISVAAVLIKSPSSKHDAVLEGAGKFDEKVEMNSVVSPFREIFGGIRLLKSFLYTIHLKEEAQAYAVATPRRVPFPYYDKVKQELDRMLALGVIKEETGPTEWVSPMVLAPKPSGAVRICVDFTHLNKWVTRERYQLPTTDELFAKLRGAKYFSTLDACSGFWQIPLSDESSRLTTFLTPYGRFRFTRLPFGLNSGPEVFHRAMRTILDGLEGVESYIDDVLIWAVTEEEHNQRLRQVLERCKQHGLQLNGAKCTFGAQQVRYFGHILTAEGVRPTVANKGHAKYKLQ